MKYLFLSLLLSLGLQAGDRKTGNGGDAVVCGGTTELLDYYEGKVTAANSNFGSGTTEMEVANYLLRKLDRDVLRYVIYKERLDSFMSEVEFVQDALVDISDHGHIFFPMNCTVVQVAIQVNPATDPSGKRYIIHEPTWNAMDAQNKAGLILHELIYREALERRAENSKRVRLANADLAKMDQWTNSLDSLVQSIENETQVTVEENFFEHERGYSGVGYLKGLTYLIEKLMGDEAPDLYNNTVLSEMLSSSKPFALLDIMRRKTREHDDYEPWEDHIEDFTKPVLDETYAYQFDSQSLKNQIELESSIINKAILGARLPADEFSYKLDLLEIIGQSQESDLRKSVAGAQILGHLFRDGTGKPLSGDYEIRAKDFIYEYITKEELARLLDILMNNFEILMVKDKVFPFGGYSDIGRASRGQVGKLRWVLQGAPESFKALLRDKVVELVDNSDTFSKVKFTNLVDLLESYNNLRSTKQPVTFSEANYQKLLLRSEDYLARDKERFWNVVGGIVETVSDAKPYIEQCIVERNSDFVTYGGSYGDLSNNCERMIVKSGDNTAHEIDLGANETKNLVDIEIRHAISFYSGTKPFEEAFDNLLDYNLLLYPDELNRLVYHEIGEVVNDSSGWHDRKIEIVALLTELDDNIVSGIKFSFDTEDSTTQEQIIRKILGTLSTLSQKAVDFLNEVASGSYSQEVKAAAIEVLQNN